MAEIFNNLSDSNSIIFIIFFSALGAVFGSFFALIISRLPQGKSIVLPQSSCDSCEKKLYFWHNIPIISWLILCGRCWFCKEKIPPRFLLIEIIFSLLMVSLFLRHGISFVLVEKFIFSSLLITIAFIDLDTFYIPLSLLGMLLFVGIISNLCKALFLPDLHFVSVSAPFLKNLVLPFTGFSQASNAILGALFGFAFLAIINCGFTFVFRKSGRLSAGQWAMGWGDPILLASIGIFVGASHILLVVFLAAFLGSVIGLLQKIVGRHHESEDKDIANGALPFGPFLALSAIYVYL